MADNFKFEGCAQYRTPVYGLSSAPMSDNEWNRSKLIGILLPCPDPTGAQGAGGGYGVGLDIMLETIHRESPEPVRVAVFYLTRAYSFSSVYQGDILARPPNVMAISNCQQYMFNDIDQLKPDHLILCGPEVGTQFFTQYFDLPEFRRKTNLSITIKGRKYPAQITYNPHFCTVVPAYIKCIHDDCRKLFEKSMPLPKGSYKLLLNYKEAMDYLDWLCQYDGFISVDTETKNLNRVARNPLATIQFATDTSLGYVIPYQHKETPFTPEELVHLKAKFTYLFSGKINAAGWIGHNIKFEHTVFDQHFGTRIVSADSWDTQAMAFLLDETRSERKADVPRGMGMYTLKILSWDFLGFNHYNEGILKEREEGNLFDLPLKQLADYGAMDAYVTFALKERIEEMAAEQGYLKQLIKLTKNYYGPASHLIAHVEKVGFKTNLARVRELASNRGPFQVRLLELEKQMEKLPAFKAANVEVAKLKNAGSAKGVLGTVPWVLDFSKKAHRHLIFFKVMGLVPVSWSEKTGEPAIDDEFFDKYREENPEVDLFSQYVETEKMLDTFINKTLQRIDPETGDADCRVDQRIRPSFHISRLVTGRWAVTHPNMQQIPKPEEVVEEGALAVRKAVKDLFTVDPGYGLIQVDYKVNEVRWAAILAQDSVLASKFNAAALAIAAAQLAEDPKLLKEAEFAEDIHRQTATDMFNCTLEQVTKTQRSAAKGVTFGILFQQSAKALALILKCSEEQAEKYISMYFEKMVGVAKLIADLKGSAETRGFVEAPHGRRRRFWAFYLPRSWRGRNRHVSRNKRQSVNSPIQGIASDAAMIGGGYSALEYIEQNKLDWKIVNLVHDSAIFQIPQNQIAQACQVMQSLFVDAAMKRMAQLGVEFNLPLGIDVEVGIDWGSLEKWNGTATKALELEQMVKDYWEKQ
jgi:DNA polymerase-1